MNKKRIFYLSIAIVALGVLIFSSIAAIGGSVWSELGNNAKEIYKENGTTIATVNGEAVTEQELKTAKAFTQAQGKSLGNQELFDKVIDDKLLISEAKKRGLYPDDKETQEYITDIRSTIDDARSKGLLDKESEEQHKSFLSGLGMTEEEYWNNETTIKGYQYSLAIAKLRGQLAQEWGFTDKKLLTTEVGNEFEKRIKEMVKASRNNAKIEILKDISSIK